MRGHPVDERWSPEERGALPALAARAAVGGVLMGLANLVPGISGGTMLLAAGVYTRFIEAVAEVTTLKLRFRSVVILGSIGIAAALAIALLAGPVKYLVTTHRWVMYSLFIGLTLGGVPLVWRRARPATPSLYAGAAAGFGAMAAMAVVQTGATGEGHWLVLLVAGIAGASAMILPGVSGAYLLLVLGQYEVILGAIDQVKRGLSGDFSLVLDAMRVVIPVGIGVLIGVVGISNLVRWTLGRYPKGTYGVLLGLLFGAVLGIWPFQAAGEHGTERVFYTPGVLEIAAAMALVGVGFGITRAIDHIGKGGGKSVASG
jgi:putative membrane protein